MNMKITGFEIQTSNLFAVLGKSFPDSVGNDSIGTGSLCVPSGSSSKEKADIYFSAPDGFARSKFARHPAGRKVCVLSPFKS